MSSGPGVRSGGATGARRARRCRRPPTSSSNGRWPRAGSRRSIDVARCHGVLQRGGDIVTGLEGAAGAVEHDPLSRPPRATPAALAGTRRTGGGSGTTGRGRRTAPRRRWRRRAVRARRRHRRYRTSRHSSGIERFEHRGVHEEVDDVAREARQDLAEQEVGHRPVRARERLEERVAPHPALQRDRRRCTPAGQPSVSSCKRRRSSAVRSTAGSWKKSATSEPAKPGRRCAARAGHRASGGMPVTAAGRRACRRRTGSAAARHR